MRLVMAIRTFIHFDELDFVSKRETWTEYSVWEAVEISTALFCANVPPMTTILRHTFRRLASTVRWPSLSSFSSPAETGRVSGEKDSNDSKPTYQISKKVSVDVEQGYVDQSENDCTKIGGSISINGAAASAAATRGGTQAKAGVAPWENGMLEPQPDPV